jgi:hypothetical protein
LFVLQAVLNSLITAYYEPILALAASIMPTFERRGITQLVMGNCGVRYGSGDGCELSRYSSELCAVCTMGREASAWIAVLQSGTSKSTSSESLSQALKQARIGDPSRAIFHEQHSWHALAGTTVLGALAVDPAAVSITQKSLNGAGLEATRFSGT